MELQKIIDIVEIPLNKMVGDKMLHYEYRKISKENPTYYKESEDNYNYDMLLWWNHKFNISITIKIEEELV